MPPAALTAKFKHSAILERWPAGGESLGSAGPARIMAPGMRGERGWGWLWLWGCAAVKGMRDVSPPVRGAGGDGRLGEGGRAAGSAPGRVRDGSALWGRPPLGELSPRCKNKQGQVEVWLCWLGSVLRGGAAALGLRSWSARRAAALPPVVLGKGGEDGGATWRGVTLSASRSTSGTDIPKTFSWLIRVSRPPKREGFTNPVALSRPAFISSSSVILPSFN